MSIDSSQHISPANDFASIAAAADLIRTIDSAFAEAASFAISAANDVEDSRRNARVASEIVRLFSSNRNRSTEDVASNLMERIPVFASPFSSDGFVASKPLSPPLPPPSSNPNVDPILVLGDIQAKTINNTTSSDPLVDGPPLITTPNRRRQHRNISASERLARAHAEDVLSITLELEKMKQTLETEQKDHDETKSALMQAKAKNAQAEAQIEKLLYDMETHREDDGRKVDQLGDELAQAQIRVKAAEEDAQVALDLAKENAESREQLETWLQKALDEIQLLREHIMIIEAKENACTAQLQSESKGPSCHESVLPGESVLRQENFRTTSTNNSYSPPSKAMVAAGRSVLEKSIFQHKDVAAESKPVDESIEAAAQLSRRLRDRLKSLGVEEEYMLPQTSDPSETGNWKEANAPSRGKEFGAAVEALDVCRNVAYVLKDSGRKLNLTGRWWADQADPQLDEIYLETLARHYCTAVEVELDRKHKEIQELESLCSVWEDRIAMDQSSSETEGCL